MGMKDVTHERQQVSPVQSSVAGLAAVFGGDQHQRDIDPVPAPRAGIEVLLVVQVLQ